jgi:L-amino acid N-acyltransferase
VLTIRQATALDVAAITGLYNALIPTTTIAWTEKLQTVEERRIWIDHQQSTGFPVLVAIHDNQFAGFCSYGHFRGAGVWPGYSRTAEHTIHIDRLHWGRGVGRALMTQLINHAQLNKMHVLIGAVDSVNTASIEFHTRLGFTEVGRLPEVGHKFGRWLDLVLMQKILDASPLP